MKIFVKAVFNKYVKIEKTSQISLLKCTNATTKVYKLLSNMNIEENETILPANQYNQ